MKLEKRLKQRKLTSPATRNERKLVPDLVKALVTPPLVPVYLAVPLYLGYLLLRGHSHVCVVDRVVVDPDLIPVPVLLLYVRSPYWLGGGSVTVVLGRADRDIKI